MNDRSKLTITTHQREATETKEATKTKETMTNKKTVTQISKFLSLVLRHKPETIGLELEANGWVAVETLLRKMNDFGKQIDLATLTHVVENNNKTRFAFNEDGTRIRANQGHSLKIDLGYATKDPPETLFHGTAQRFLESIMESGLEKRSRHHVHLSPDRATAIQVGKRHGKPIVLTVLAGEMHRDGHEFFESDNGVWLTDHVPVRYLHIETK